VADLDQLLAKFPCDAAEAHIHDGRSHAVIALSLMACLPPSHNTMSKAFHRLAEISLLKRALVLRREELCLVKLAHLFLLLLMQNSDQRLMIRGKAWQPWHRAAVCGRAGGVDRALLFTCRAAPPFWQDGTAP
jgi:hypothetical protein